MTLACQVIVIIAPPPNIAYPFILDIEGYPQQIINLFVVIVGRSSLDHFSSASALTLVHRASSGFGIGNLTHTGLSKVRNRVLRLREDAEHSDRVTVWWPLAVFYLAAAVFREQLRHC